MSDADTKTAGLGLKVGDEIVIDHYQYGSTSYYRARVVGKSPTGRINTSRGFEFNPDGTRRGERNSYGRMRIVPFTQEVREWFDREAAIRSIQRFAKESSVHATADLRRVADLIAEIERGAETSTEAAQPKED